MKQNPPYRQVRARFNDATVRVYQAYSHAIASNAIAAQKFVSPFKRERMTWIKPSFTWMMYRAGWGRKPDQEVVLGIDIRREGFEWALAHSALSHRDPGVHASDEAWQAAVRQSPVRIQWDPERTVKLGELAWRAIQIGLGGRAVDAYVDEWIVRIEDMMPLVTQMERLVTAGDRDGAEALRPVELPYPLPPEIATHIGCTSGPME